MPRKKSTITIDGQTPKERLKTLKQAFADWRQTRTKDETIPNSLWIDATPLANYFTPKVICAALEISTRQFDAYLKNKELSLPIQKNNKSKTHAFVELQAPKTNNTISAVFTRSNGVIMRLEGLMVNHASQLVKDFIG